MEYLWAFLIGGGLCAIAQIVIDKFKFPPAKIMVSYVVIGAILTLFGLYKPFAEFAGQGATTPIMGFGFALAKGAMEEVSKSGLIGAFSGGLIATSAGIGAVLFFGYFFALAAKLKGK